MSTNSPFISLLSDYGFKVAFADETNTLFLRRALQALIQSANPIEEVRFLRHEFTGLTQQSRGGFFDLACTDEKDRTFIVEMQLGHYKHFIQRSKFYAFQQLNTLVSKGRYRFEDLTPIYCIGFLAKGIFPQSNEYYHFGRLKNQKGEEMDNQTTHIIVEINKFKKDVQDIHSDLDKLIYTMKNLSKIKGLDELPEFLTEDWIEQALNKVDISQMSPEQRMHYEMMLARNGSILQMRDEEMKAAKKETAERVAKEKDLEAAKKMKQLGVELSIIAATTGLSIEAIKQL